MSDGRKKSAVAQVSGFLYYNTIPRLYVGKEWFVGWYSFDPVEKKMRRKKIKLNHIHSKTERRRYASDLIGRVYEQLHIRKPLGLPAKYKFYSLKDTGVTMMLRANTDVLSVRDQARHSSILITDTYTPHDIAKVNPLIDKFECGF